MAFRAGQDHDAPLRRHDRYRGRQARPYRAAGEFRPLPAQRRVERSERPDHVGDVRCRLVCRRQRRHAGHAGNRARQERVPARRHHDGRRHRAQRRTSDAQCDRRQAPGEPDRRRQAAGRRPSESAGRHRLGHWRLYRRHAAPAARRAGATHARPRHRRAVVLHRPRGEDAHRRSQAAGAVAAEHDAAHPGQDRGPQGRRRGADRGCRGRCRHSQSDQLQAAVAERLLSRPARAVGGDPRSLRRPDRRHAGHTRPDPHRRRRRRRVARQSADRAAGVVLFRHRHRRCRRQRRRRFRHSRLRRHRPRHGGGLDQGQGRPGHRPT